MSAIVVFGQRVGNGNPKILFLPNMSSVQELEEEEAYAAVLREEAELEAHTYYWKILSDAENKLA